MTRMTGSPTPASSRMNAASVSSNRRSVARTQYHARCTCSANGMARLLSMNRFSSAMILVVSRPTSRPWVS